MEDIDCQSEQLIAPNKLQMFFMHSCSIYLCMCINFKKKTVKSVSVLALSLQSFICLQAVRCRFCIFFPSVFFYIFLSRRLSSGHESSQRLRCCSVLSLTVMVFFFLRFLFFWSIFAPLLKKFRAHVQRPRGRARSQMGKNGRWVFEMVSNQSVKVPKTETQIAGEDVSTRGSSAPAPMMMCAGGSPFSSPASISGPLILLSPPLSGCQSHGGGRWLAAVDFSS